MAERSLQLPSMRLWPQWPLRLLWGLTLGLALGGAAAAAEPSAIEAQSRALQRASAAVVGLRAQAVEDARSAATLGRVRQGSGVVIGNGDLVLTIGYLILEAEQVQLITDDEREVPARLVGYDVATGFGLVQPLAPLHIEPASLGAGAALARGEALMIVSGGEDGVVSAAQLISRRGFSGYWEYHVDGALFTAPPRADHSGAGLFNGRGELVGIGSLLLKDAADPGAPPLTGNMFVPIDLLVPILPELRSRGSSGASRRAWLGVNCVETEGSVRVVRVIRDSPAEVAGVEPGDRIVRIDGTEVHALDVLWKTLWAGGAAERESRLDIVRDGAARTLKVQSVDRMKTLRSARGI
ncbi:MAG TPA: S1C family serine protease [Rubrivivax sp.]|nr:S1C family serine protease [Rubrivivax sp.]